MKLLLIKHKGQMYQFRLMEESSKILIIKGNEMKYTMSVGKNGCFDCNCPGSTYHGHCWHNRMVKPLLNMPIMDMPWCEWAEEYCLDVAR